VRGPRGRSRNASPCFCFRTPSSSFLLCKPCSPSVSPSGLTGSDLIPQPTAYIASCLVASSLRSPPLSSPSRRIALIPLPKMLLCRSRTSCAPGVTFDASQPCRFFLFFFFYLKSFHPSFNSARFYLFLRKIKFARDLVSPRDYKAQL
jgi:hypothetical protein